MYRRVLQEFRIPETTEGIYVRLITVGLYNAAVKLLSPFIFLGATFFRQDSKVLYYFYDLEVSSITYDIADYLAMAELERRRRRCIHIYIYVVPGRSGGLRDEGETYEKVVDRTNRLWRLSNLVIPIFELLPSCSGYSVCRDRRQATLFRILAGYNVFPATYWPAFPIGLFRRPLLESARQGLQVFPMFRAPEQSIKYIQQWLTDRVGSRKAITITLREYAFDHGRNSNTSEWVAFARNLDANSFVPIFVLDTDTAMAPVPDALKDFLVFHEAPWNVALRSALYERAYLNLAIVHGPTALLWYNHRCRYLLFFPQGDTSQTGPAYLHANGFIRGESLPFAGPLQKWVWEPDDAAIIQREFEQMCGAIEDASRKNNVDVQGLVTAIDLTRSGVHETNPTLTHGTK